MDHVTSCDSLPRAVVTVNFAPREYSVSEADGHVEVCASITGFSELPLSVNITTRPNSALGEPWLLLVGGVGA